MPKSSQTKHTTRKWRHPRKLRPLTHTRHWIHPSFEVGIFIENPRALPVRVHILRHTDGALSVGSSSDSVRVTAVDRLGQDCQPEIYSIDKKSEITAVPDENGDPVVWPNFPRTTSFNLIDSYGGSYKKRKR